MILPNHVLEKMAPIDRAKLGKAGLTASECSAKAEAKREKEIQKEIASELSRRGIWFTRSAMNRKTTNTVGTPDFLFAIKGKACAIEVKVPGKYPEPHQRKVMSEMMENGWNVAVACSLDQVIDFIKGMAR